jgi:hypothetical protein
MLRLTRFKAVFLALACLPALALSNPSVQVMGAFLRCDASFFKSLAQHGALISALKPHLRQLAGIAHLKVTDRSNEEGQSLTLNPVFEVNGLALNEFVDEITFFNGREGAVYYWGFNTDAPLTVVLPVMQGLLPNNTALTADGDTWARIDVFEKGAWRNVARHAELKGKPALLPERALIVETHEGGGTRIICGLQAAPLPASELKRLRPDL